MTLTGMTCAPCVRRAQVNAARAGLESIALMLLRDHTEHCVSEAIRAGEGTAKVRELSEAVERLVKS